MQSSIGIDGSTPHFPHVCEQCKFICCLDVNSRKVDYYVCKGRLGRLELVWRYGRQEHQQSGMFAEPLSRMSQERILKLDIRAKHFYIFAHRNKLGHMLNT